ncbi:DEAD/DEAH box helicase [Candidatus Woesearchaeota archaeon]|nr:DEAD/DEAH box helicase [Candidatus Woesearchaeota archaeon]
MKFEDFKLSNELLRNIKEIGYNEPTDIQSRSIPLIIEGKDVIGESATGSGKTLAFGTIISEKVIPNKGIQALVITPTRELANQVKDSLKLISKHRNLNITAIYGGVAIDPQINVLRRAEVVVGTPGRLCDHLQRNTINLSKVNILVLDEADRMFEMGFIEDIEKIIKSCPKERQNLFFSATISDNIRRLAQKYMNSPIKVSANNLVDPEKLKQVYYNITRGMKLSLLVYLLEHEKSGLVMVFCNTRRNVDFIAKNLQSNKIKAIPIHGGLSQNKRNNTIEMFNDAKVQVLVCTDVASRGLHIDNVSHIYNYDIPKNPKDYVHRIGRTARAGEEGKVINILSEDDHPNMSSILREYSFKIEKMEKIMIERINAVRVEENRGFRRVPFHNKFRRGFSRNRNYAMH